MEQTLASHNLGNDSDSIKKSLFTNNDYFSITTLYSKSQGYVSGNKNLFANMDYTPLTKFILNESLKGTPLIKLGHGDLKVMILAGVHGNELPPQNAALMLVNKLRNLNLNGTVYIIPFAAPEATMYNIRNYNGQDINRTSMIKGSLGNLIIDKIKDLGISYVADFHSTAPNANPGKEGVFCTIKPSPKSFDIASFISEDTNSSIINFNNAGAMFKGAIEDECNLIGIPAVTCEVISTIGYLSLGSTKRSLNQMISFLKYCNIL